MLTGGMESKAEWMKGSLATLVRGKLTQSQRDLPTAQR